MTLEKFHKAFRLLIAAAVELGIDPTDLRVSVPRPVEDDILEVTAKEGQLFFSDDRRAHPGYWGEGPALISWEE